jgi:hypothetical protein
VQKLPVAVKQLAFNNPLTSATKVLRFFYWKVFVGDLGRRDEFGQRYTIDLMLEWQDRNATMRCLRRATPTHWAHIRICRFTPRANYGVTF